MIDDSYVSGFGLRNNGKAHEMPEVAEPLYIYLSGFIISSG